MYVKVKGHEVIEPWFNSKYAIELRAQTLGSQIVINNPLHQQLFCSVLKYPLKLDLHCKIADCLHKLGAHKYCLKQQALSPKQQWLMVVLISNQFTLDCDHKTTRNVCICKGIVQPCHKQIQVLPRVYVQKALSIWHEDSITSFSAFC